MICFRVAKAARFSFSQGRQSAKDHAGWSPPDLVRIWVAKYEAGSFDSDVVAAVGVLQQAMSGRHFFEVRDDHSNEKVGEVTAFSGSLEVYK